MSEDSCSSCQSCGDGNSERLPPGMLCQYNLNQETSDGILVFIELVETENGVSLHPSVPGILTKAREISEGRLFGVMFAKVDGKDLYDELFSYGIDTLYHMRNPKHHGYSPKAYSETLSDVVKRVSPSSVLLPATAIGRELAPLTAAILETGLTADCTDLKTENNRLIMIRPALGGNIIASIVSDSYPNMATVRPGAFTEIRKEEGRRGTAISLPYKIDEECRKIKSDGNSDITESKILISIGNGVRKKSSVDYAYRIAESIGANVSCSRAVVDKGWLPQSQQVGQSGKIVSPDVYIVFGISGSVQHMAGVRAKKIISVNKDRNAPISSSCDIVITGDCDTILKKWADSLQN